MNVKKRAKQPEAPGFDTATACRLTEAFARLCGVPCRLVDAQGNILHRQMLGSRLCELCVRSQACGLRCRSDAGEESCPGCARCGQDGQEGPRRQLYSAVQAERFGGRYIYCCPAGMGWISVPIFFGGRLAGSLSAGPVLIMGREDYLASLQVLQQDISPERLEEFERELESCPCQEPEMLSHMSVQLAASALYIGDYSRALVEQWQQTVQQQDISNYLQQLKYDGASLTYPREKEKYLLEAVREGNRAGARQLINELLGHLLFSQGDSAVIRQHALELVSLLSRAAMDAGADVEQAILLNRRYLAEGEALYRAEELSGWLVRVADRFAALAFDARDIRHRDAMLRAVNFMKLHLSRHITLEEVAAHASFSPSYFSKTFKEEMGQSFNRYLSRLRINESKTLLLVTDRPLKDVCAAVGFEDQSYFTKVFRQQTGVTPAQYRKKQGRLDAAKERTTDGPANT